MKSIVERMTPNRLKRGPLSEGEYAREGNARKLKALKRAAAERERKMLETTSLGKLIK